MAKFPSLLTVDSLLKSAGSVKASTGGSWYPARPLGYPSLRHRFRCAWLVFTGKADAVIWPEGQ